MKKNWKNELKKLKDMPAGDRLWYIWEYYKIPLLGCVLTVFLLYEAIACIYRNMQDTMLYCVTINETHVSSADLAAVQKEFEARNGIDQTWRQDTEFDISLSMEGSGEDTSDFFYSSASTIKFESLVATHTIDVLITVPDMLAVYTNENLFLDLEEILPSELYSDLEARGLIIRQKDSDGNEISAGISLDASPLSEKLKLAQGSSLSVCTMENHPDMIFDFILYALGE